MYVSYLVSKANYLDVYVDRCWITCFFLYHCYIVVHSLVAVEVKRETELYSRVSSSEPVDNPV